jgi:hypothetical protein
MFWFVLWNFRFFWQPVSKNRMRGLECIVYQHGHVCKPGGVLWELENGEFILLRERIVECIPFPTLSLCKDDQKYVNWKKERKKKIALMSQTGRLLYCSLCFPFYNQACPRWQHKPRGKEDQHVTVLQWEGCPYNVHPGGQGRLARQELHTHRRPIWVSVMQPTCSSFFSSTAASHIH